jgi:hypothetical protein
MKIWAFIKRMAGEKIAASAIIELITLALRNIVQCTV